MRIEVVGDQGRGQVAEVELEDGADTVDVMHDTGVASQVGHSLIVKQSSAMITSWSDVGQKISPRN